MAYQVQQPMVPMAQPTVNWDTGLFDCCTDCSTCCYGFWCCPCLACTVAGSFGENNCLPLCDMCSPTICGLPLCVPPAHLSLRVGIRHSYNIKGSICDDIAVSCFCVCCSWCQMQRELKHRKRNTVAVINAQPQQVISVQQQGPVVHTQPVFVNQQQQVHPQPQPQLYPQPQPQLYPQPQPQPYPQPQPQPQPFIKNTY